MLDKSKLKYFSCSFVILPITTIIVFTIVKLLEYKIGNESTYYKWIDNLLAHSSVLLIILLFSCVSKKNSLLKEFVKCNVIFYISFLISLLSNFLIYNLDFLHHCKFDYDISFVINIYITGVVLSSLATAMCSYLVNIYKIKFSFLDAIILSTFILMQFFLTHGFRII